MSAFIAQYMRLIRFPKRQTGSKFGVKNTAAATTKVDLFSEGHYNKLRNQSCSDMLQIQENVSTFTGLTVMSSEISCCESADISSRVTDDEL